MYQNEFNDRMKCRNPYTFLLEQTSLTFSSFSGPCCKVSLKIETVDGEMIMTLLGMNSLF